MTVRTVREPRVADNERRGRRRRGPLSGDGRRRAASHLGLEERKEYSKGNQGYEDACACARARTPDRDR